MQLIQERSSSRGAMKVVQTSKGIRIRIQAAFLFRSGHAAVRQEALPTLKNIASILARTKRPIRVEGHTDNVPIHGRYKNNWALSTMRAVNVLTELIALGPLDPRQVSAAGYGQYRPLVPNDSGADRQKNRRVEIVILKGEEPSLPPPAPAVSSGISPGVQEDSGAPPVPAPAPPASTDLPAPRI
ncbi:MAG: hypothetical protein D084_Lepto4C00634G0003 [Leptospirillum sp. Group IV 'UBA BS']|nr:MAG: hypothetical protein D084_Lepto4C00634G0003 [Leptospirillum sp. Group IV 'UBA BS']